MTIPPPVPRTQETTDAEHIKLLSVFHFVFAGLSILGLGFLFLHWLLLHTVIDNPEVWKHQPAGPSPQEFFNIFKWFYLFFGVCIVLAGLANALSGWFLRKRRCRTCSLVIAGLDCMIFPVGTALGVFTFIVLLRDSVRERYEAPPDKPGRH